MSKEAIKNKVNKIFLLLNIFSPFINFKIFSLFDILFVSYNLKLLLKKKKSCLFLNKKIDLKKNFSIQKKVIFLYILVISHFMDYIINKLKKIAKNPLAKSKNNPNNIILDKKGNVFTSLAILMTFIIILTGIFIMNVAIDYNNITSNSIDSDNFNYVIQDYERNIPIATQEAMGEIADDVIKTYKPCDNSSLRIQKRVKEKLNEINKNYETNQGLTIESEVLNVVNGDDPFHINIKTSIHAKKGSLEYNQIIDQKVSIENLKDPLPFLMCKNYPSLIENNSKINYKDSLKNYFVENNLLNPDAYLNASSPLIIKRCPYDPYVHHGDSYTLKNCIDNGYYHESADGSCYLCRLEGKGGCFHYGVETFIIPNTANNFNLKSISSSDHVVFADYYPGDALEFYSCGGFYEIIFLDNAHRAKYGLGS